MRTMKQLVWDNWMERLDYHFPDDDHKPHLINMIGSSCGWLPMEVGQKWKVSFGEAKYEIRRLR